MSKKGKQKMEKTVGSVFKAVEDKNKHRNPGGCLTPEMNDVKIEIGEAVIEKAKKIKLIFD